MENGQEIWDFAQKYSSKQIIKYQIVYLFTVLLGFLPFNSGHYAWLLAITLNVAFIIIPIITTERKLKEKLI